MKKYFLFLSLFILSVYGYAQHGILDSDFSADGKLLDWFDTGSDKGVKVIAQPDGKILVGGRAYFMGDVDFVVIRYNADGSLDNSFYSGQGKLTYNFGSEYNDYANAMVLQPDGKITLAGHTDEGGLAVSICLARFLPDGADDSDFGGSGSVIVPSGTDYFYTYALDVSAAGKYAVTGNGSGDLFVAQFNADGSVDTDFGTGGIARVQSPQGFSSAGYDVKYQPDGKILATGYYGGGGNINAFLVRFNSDGTLDNTFSFDGMVDTDFSGNFTDRAYSILLLDDGKIFIAGYTNNDIVMFRYNSDGSLDQTFNGWGKELLDFGANESISSIAEQPDGKLLLGGITYNSVTDVSQYMLVRINSDGTPDNTFGANGQVVTSFGNFDYAELTSVTLQPDLRILVTGGVGDFASALDIATARYLSGLNVGIADFSKNVATPLIYPNPVKQIETLEYTLLQDEVITIELFDVNGSLVKTFMASEKRTAGAQRETLAFPLDMAAGNYSIRLSSNTGQQSIKLVKH